MITAAAMLVTGFVSSRIGAKKTPIAGLVAIVCFSALAGASHSIGGLVGVRAGWGLGNVLFIATSLAAIVSSASGGFIGGGIAPWAAGKIAAHHGDHLPFYLAAAAIAAAIGVLASGHRLLDHAEAAQAVPEPLDSELVEAA